MVLPCFDDLQLGAFQGHHSVRATVVCVQDLRLRCISYSSGHVFAPRPFKCMRIHSQFSQYLNTSSPFNRHCGAIVLLTYNQDHWKMIPSRAIACAPIQIYNSITENSGQRTTSLSFKPVWRVPSSTEYSVHTLRH